MKLIGDFSKCHGDCGNNNKVSFVANLLVLHVTNMGKFRLNMIFGLSFKQAAKEKKYVPILYFNPGKHRIVIKQQATFLESS